MNVLKVVITVTYLLIVSTLMGASHVCVQRVQRVLAVEQSAQVRYCLSGPFIVVSTINDVSP